LAGGAASVFAVALTPPDVLAAPVVALPLAVPALVLVAALPPVLELAEPPAVVELFSY
jgi:hypothetical protein